VFFPKHHTLIQLRHSTVQKFPTRTSDEKARVEAELHDKFAAPQEHVNPTRTIPAKQIQKHWTVRKIVGASSARHSTFPCIEGTGSQYWE
jgi:hypothetical protein